MADENNTQITSLVETGERINTSNIEIRVHAEFPFKNEAEVPEELWRTFFEGGAETHDSSALDVLESLLINDGDYVYLKGSTVERILYGIYLFDTSTKTIPGPLKSDLDIVVPTTELYERTDAVTPEDCDVKIKYVSKTIQNGSTEMGFIELERLKRGHEVGLSELEDWANSIESSEQQAYFLGRIEQIRDQLALEDYQLVDASFLHEAISLKLERKEGKLVATVVDAGNLLENADYIEQKESTRAAGNPVPPFKFFENDVSTTLLYLEAMQQMTLAEFDESVFPILALGTIPRVIKADTQDLMFFTPFYNEQLWQNMYNICERVHHKEAIFKYGEKVQDYYSNKGLVASESLLIPDIQAGFLRGCKNDPIRAYELVFQQFPLGFVFSEEVHSIFEEMHTEENRGVYVSDAYKDFGELSPAAKAKYRWGVIARKELDYRERTPIVIIGEDKKETEASFPTYGKSFEDINEVFSILFASFNWEVQKDDAKIREVLDNWSGIWDASAGWALNPEVANFKTEINLDKIKTRISELRNEYKQLYE